MSGRLKRLIQMVLYLYVANASFHARPEACLNAFGRLATSGARLLKRRVSGWWLVPIRTDFLNGARPDGL
jgi:hypothetical protein